MEISYHKAWSRQLGRDMEYKRYGYAGRPVVVFPTSKGTFYQFEDQGGVGALSELIDSGRIQLFTIDGVDAETFFNKGGDNAGRIARHEAYFRYVREEALPELATHGCRVEWRARDEADIHRLLDGRLPRVELRHSAFLSSPPALFRCRASIRPKGSSVTTCPATSFSIRRWTICRV